nr:hypothetical protein [Angustibacter aerolatus]
MNGQDYGYYRCDALVVSTATGSTAYNFAAGGPVVSPSAQVVVVTPVAPTAGISRAVVLGPDDHVRLRVAPDSAEARRRGRRHPGGHAARRSGRRGHAARGRRPGGAALGRPARQPQPGQAEPARPAAAIRPACSTSCPSGCASASSSLRDEAEREG